jgi:hypothetical protein
MLVMPAHSDGLRDADGSGKLNTKICSSVPNLTGATPCYGVNKRLILQFLKELSFLGAFHGKISKAYVRVPDAGLAARIEPVTMPG